MHVYTCVWKIVLKLRDLYRFVNTGMCDNLGQTQTMTYDVIVRALYEWLVQRPIRVVHVLQGTHAHVINYF